jgi:hypothetical protein
MAPRKEEMSHYPLEMGMTGKPSPFSTFYYPPKMFSDAQTRLNLLVTLEDAFIAAYIVGVGERAVIGRPEAMHNGRVRGRV